MSTAGLPGPADRRDARRYRLALPVELGNSQGRTHDISISGVFLEGETARSFTLGESVSLILRLEHVDAGYPVRLQVKACQVWAHEEWAWRTSRLPSCIANGSPARGEGEWTTAAGQS